MNAWFVILRNHSHVGIPSPALWDGTAGEWTAATGTAYRTREDAEAAAFYHSVTHLESANVGVWSFEEILQVYGWKGAKKKPCS